MLLRFDDGVPPAERLLFPGRNRGQPMTTRQLGRLFQEIGVIGAMIPRLGYAAVRTAPMPYRLLILTE